MAGYMYETVEVLTEILRIILISHLPHTVAALRIHKPKKKRGHKTYKFIDQKRDKWVEKFDQRKNWVQIRIER